MNSPKLNSPHFSAGCLLRGLRLIFQPELRRFVWIPLLLNLGLYAVALWLGIRYFSAFMAWLLPAWLGFLSWLLWPVFALAFLLILYFTFTMVANLVGSPFYGALAEKVMARATGGALVPVATAWHKGMATEARRLGYFLSRAAPLLVLFLIPGVNLIAPVLWLAFNAWFLGMEYLAYPAELLGIEFEAQRQIGRRLRWGVLGFGGTALLGLAVPGLNILVPPAAVAGATLYALEGRLKDEPQPDSATR
jgi:CysZ protein